MRFSVVIPAYNAEGSLGATVASARAQGLSDFEIVISNDGSTDGTLALARRLAEADPRIVVVDGANGGCSAARNRGFDVAAGEYGVLLDSDDLLGPDYLAAMSAFIDARPGFDIYSCNGTRRFGDGRTEPFLSGPAYAAETSWALSDLIFVDRIFVMAAVKRELWERVGGFCTDLRYAEDYDFWLRSLALGARQIFTPQRLGVAVSLASSKSKDRIPHAESQIRIFSDLAAMPELSAEQRRQCAEKIALLHTRIARVELETRLQRGDYARARRTYLRVRSAYLSSRLYLAGLAVMLVSPRLYASLFARRDARRSQS